MPSVEDNAETGDGWQARVDSVLRQCVNEQAPRSNAT